TQDHGTGGSGAPSANIPPDGRERCREAEGSDRPLTLTVTHLAVTHLAVAHLGHSPRRRHPELCKDVAIRAGTHHFAEVDGQVGGWAFRSMGASLGSRAWRAAGSVDDRAAVLQHGLAVLLGSVVGPAIGPLQGAGAAGALDDGQSVI